MRRLLTSLASFGIVCCVTAPTYAQSAIGGIVKDANGRVVVGARVTVKDLVSQRERQTSSSPIGHYEIAKLPPGVYFVTVESEFYEPFVEQVALVRHIMARLDVVLIIRHKERITVLGDTASTGPLASGDLAHGATFSRSAIESMPLPNGRTVQSMLALVPGIVFTDSVGTLAQFTALGQRRLSNRLTIDGVNADLAVQLGAGVGEAGSGALPAFGTTGGTQTLIPLDAVEEIHVNTAALAPERARTPGAQTSIITRAGGDQVKATAFANGRPDSLSARDWFTNSGSFDWLEGATPMKRGARQMEGGASIGGPLGRRDRLHYFGVFEQQYIERPATTTVQVPSESARRDAPAELRALLNAFPHPNGADVGNGLAEFSHTFAAASNLMVASLRMDAELSDRHRGFVRFNHGRSRGDGLLAGYAPPFTFQQAEQTTTTTATAGLTSMYGNAAVHDLRTNVSVHQGSSRASHAGFGSADALPLATLTPPTIARDDAWVNVVAFPGMGGALRDGLDGANRQFQIQIADTWTWARGGHSWRVGFDYLGLTASTDPASDRYAYRFASVPALLQGRLRSLTHQRLVPARARLATWSFFMQDDYRVTSRMSISYGVRYSIRPAPHSLTDVEPVLIRFDTLPRVEVLPAGSPMWKTSWTNVSPRLATAWQLRRSAGFECTARAGWSIIHDEITSPGAAAFGRGFPYVQTRAVQAVAFPVPAADLVWTGQTSIDDAQLAEVYALSENLRAPRTYAWHAGIDQGIGRAQRLSVAYLGATGRDLVYPHRHVLGTGLQSVVVNAFSNDARSDYRALSLEYVRRNAAGWNLRASYTVGRSTDTDSGEPLSPNPPPALITPAINEGLSDFDRRHVFQASGSYRLSPGVLPPPLRLLLGALQLDVVATLRSGTPFNVTTNVGGYNVRPDLVSGLPVWITDETAPGGARLNPAAFSAPADLRQGSLRRNSLRSLPLRQVDVALSRSIRLGGRTVLVARLEAFNVLNLANFAVPDAMLFSPGFGRSYRTYAEGLGTGTLALGGLVASQQVGGPRSLQLGVRLSY